MRTTRQRMAADLKIAGYSPSTAQIYLIYAGKFIDHYNRPPQQLGADHIRNYLLYLIEICDVSYSTLRQARAALKFLYAVTLGKPQVIDWLPPARKITTLPEVLSGTEVEALFKSVRHIMYRTMMMAMYSGGLRNIETCRLMPQDIDSKRMLIHIRRGKGGADRCTILSWRMLGQLRFYWQHHRPHLDGYLFPSATELGHTCPQTVAADQSSLDPNDLASALSLFDPIWDVLFPNEQARIIELLIRQIEYNGKSGKLAVTFHPTGIKALAGEIAQEATT